MQLTPEPEGLRRLQIFLQSINLTDFDVTDKIVQQNL